MSLGRRFLSMFRSVLMAPHFSTGELQELKSDTTNNLFVRVAAAVLTPVTIANTLTVSVTSTASATPSFAPNVTTLYLLGGLMVLPGNLIEDVVFEMSATSSFSNSTRKVLNVGGLSTPFLLPYWFCDLDEVDKPESQVPSLIRTLPYYRIGLTKSAGQTDATAFIQYSRTSVS